MNWVVRKQRYKCSASLLRKVGDGFLGLRGGSLSHFVSFIMGERQAGAHCDHIKETVNGKERNFWSPYSGLKDIQRRVNTSIIRYLKVSDHAHAYVQGRGVRTNAEAHLQGYKALVESHPERAFDWTLFRMDISKFFESFEVTEERLRKLVKKVKWNEVDPDIHSGIIFDVILGTCLVAVKDQEKEWSHRRIAPPGFPTSPGLLNALMYDFDIRIHEEATRRGLVYTRYADDLIMSGVNPKGIENFVESSLEGLELSPNSKKTILRRHSKCQRVTGIVVNSGEPTISRKTRRKLRAAIHHKKISLLNEISGSQDNILCTPLSLDQSIDTLSGRASWISSVNPGKSHQVFREKIQELRRLEKLLRDKGPGSGRIAPAGADEPAPCGGPPQEGLTDHPRHATDSAQTDDCRTIEDSP